MRIVVWGINYWPEAAGIGPFNRGMCRHLAARGHDVSMVSAFSYYPAWRKEARDRGRLFRTDIVDGLSIHRCWQYVPARPSTLRRIFHELTFSMTSLLRVLFLPRADLYIVVSPPLVSGPVARLACLLKRSRYVFHVQDLQPGAAMGLGMLKSDGLLARILLTMEENAYRHASLVSGISPSMIEAFARKGVPAEKRFYLPNWIEFLGRRPSEIQAAACRTSGAIPVNGRKPSPLVPASSDSSRAQLLQDEPIATPRSRWRERHGIQQNAFLASYSGNLGRKQGLEVLLEAAAVGARPGAQSDSPFTILIAGDGVMRPAIEESLKQRPLSNVHLMPMLSNDDYQDMLAASDICLVTQVKDTGLYFLPSKVLSIVMATRPVIAVADESSELARAVRDGEFGFVTAPGYPNGISKLLSELAGNPGLLDGLGANGLKWAAQFEADRVLGPFEARIQEVVDVRPAGLQPAVTLVPRSRPS